MAEFIALQPLGLWLYLAVAGVLYVGWWSIADARLSGDGEIAAFSLFVCLLWGLTLPVAAIVVAGIYGFGWLESTSGWLPRLVTKISGKSKK